MAYEVGDIRNLALVGHGDSGKTTFVDAVAHLTKATKRQGSVEDGTSLCDFEEEEKEKKHSLASAIAHMTFKKKVFNFIDCPGYPDFVADAVSALSVVETALIFVHGVGGVTFNTRAVWHRTETAHVARAVVVTRNDMENADFEKTLTQIRDVFGDQCVPILFPDGNQANFTKVISVLDPGDDISGEAKDRAASFYNTLVERVVETDDETLEKYLETGECSRETLDRLLPKAMTDGKLVPIFWVDNKKGTGIEQMLDMVIEFFPSPKDAYVHNAAIPGKEGETEEIKPDPSGPFAAYVFKTLTDPFVGKVSYFRVMRGTLENDGMFHVLGSEKAEKAHPHTILGKDLKPTGKVIAGDIAALTKIESLNYGGSFYVEGSPVEFPRPEQPAPMASFAITPKSAGDDQKISTAIQKLNAEDPTFGVRRVKETKEMVIDGLSELHLQIMLKRMKRRFHVEVDTSVPKVPYQEAITAKAEGHYRHKKQTGGKGQFGEVFLKVEPLERGAGFEFANEVFGGAVPRNFMPAIEKGIKETMDRGVIAGCHVVDVKAIVYDGKHHDVDSDEVSFKIAGGRAFADAFQKARPAILEPVYELEITIPTRFMGDISGDLNTRRGRIQGMDTKDDIQIIKAHVPLAEILQYGTQLRSITAGEGSYTMKFHGYDVVPGNVKEKIMAAFTAQKAAAAEAH